jgi:hypothetical protein
LNLVRFVPAGLCGRLREHRNDDARRELILGFRYGSPLAPAGSSLQLLSEMIHMTDEDMLFVAGLAGFAWWTYVFLPLVYFHS